MEEKNFYDNAPSMERLIHKGQLINNCIGVYKTLAQYVAVIPKSFRKKAERSVTRDFMKGLRVINKNNPVFVSMPKLERVGNGMVKEVDAKTKEPINNEVKVTPPVTTQSGDIIDV